MDNRKRTLDNVYFLDIITVGKYPTMDALKGAVPEAVYKDILGRIVSRVGDENAASQYGERVTLYPEVSRIVGFATMGPKGVYTRFSEDEREVLSDIVRVVNSSQKKVPVLTVCSFDLKFHVVPSVVKRLLSYGMPVPAPLKTAEKKPWELDMLDLGEVWRVTNQTFSSMESALYCVDPGYVPDFAISAHTEYWTAAAKGKEEVDAFFDRGAKVLSRRLEAMKYLFGRMDALWR